jgi:1,4-alpha-glucan branching enzyme
MLNKKFLKTKCKVEFVYPHQGDVESVHLAGDFNAWTPEATPMEKKSKTFKVTLDLDLGREYEFRYFVNGSEWQNDDDADDYYHNQFGGQNSVVKTYPPAEG